MAPSEVAKLSELEGRPVAVVGAGSWGTTIASILAGKGIETRLWARRPELAEAIEEDRENREYLPSIRLPATLYVTSDIGRASAGASLLVVAVPSHAFREVLSVFAENLGDGGSGGGAVSLVSLTKGLERGSLKRMTEVAAEVLPGISPERIGVLTGPNLAAEIAQGQPAATLIAMPDIAAAEEAQEIFMAPSFRVYSGDDVIGAELGGITKNVIAIAAGVADGLGFGDNTRATLITRGLAEAARLGVAMGADPLTFAGLAGMGDLIATCASPRSRNRSIGVRLARGESIEKITGEMKMIAEGVKSTAVVRDLAVKHGVDMPITHEVAAMLYDQKPPRSALASLLSRPITSELYGE